MVLLAFFLAGCASQPQGGLDGMVSFEQKRVAKAGDLVFVEYTGLLEDGTVFDTSVGGAPFEFVLGSGSVLKLFDKGIQGMAVGGEKEIVIPAGQGYNSGPLAGKKMIFRVKLVRIGE